MSAAQVSNATMLSPVARAAQARASVATRFDAVDSINTGLAARGRDGYSRQEEFDDFEAPQPRRRRGEFQEDVVRFSGVLLSREVGTTMMQAQATTSRIGPGSMSVHEAERHVSLYEYNQGLMGAPEVTTDNGLMH